MKHLDNVAWSCLACQSLGYPNQANKISLSCAGNENETKDVVADMVIVKTFITGKSFWIPEFNIAINFAFTNNIQLFLVFKFFRDLNYVYINTCVP